MIDPNDAIQAFKDKFSKMSYDEREQYLKEKGFSFGYESAKRKTTSIHSRSGMVGKKVHANLCVSKVPAMRKKATKIALVGAMVAKTKD